MADNEIKAGQIWVGREPPFSVEVLITKVIPAGESSLVNFIDEQGNTGKWILSSFRQDFECTDKTFDLFHQALKKAFVHRPHVGDVYISKNWETRYIVIHVNEEGCLLLGEDLQTHYQLCPIPFEWTGETIPEVKTMIKKFRGDDNAEIH